MNLKIRLLALLLFVLAGSALAQRAQMGFRLETLGMHRTHSNIYNSDTKKELFYIPFPSALQLNTSFFPVQNLSIDARLGGVFGWLGFSGFEYGLYSKYFFLNRYFFTGGVIMHHNDGNKGIFSGMGEKYSMLSFGAGMKLTKVTSVDLLLYKAGNKLLTERFSGGIPSDTFTHFDWLIKLSLDFEWGIFQ
ncbi:MAG: hypothetical protein ACM3QX_13515 [Syntrophomonadaceae bacterium]